MARYEANTIALFFCVVSECKLRHGHRLLAHKGDRVLKRKVTQRRQRKHLMTFGNFHPDALEALNLIFACAEPLLPLDRLFNNDNNNNAEGEDEMR